MASESRDCNNSNHSPNMREFRLYVAGQTPKSVLAYANLQRICETYFPKSYRIEVIDVLHEPHRAEEDRVLAVPTLVQSHPAPVRRVVGDLADTARVLAELDVTGEPGSPATDNVP